VPRAALVSANAERATRRAVPRVGVTFSCALDPGEWRNVAGVLSPPGAGEAAIGKLAWFAARVDMRTASVSVFQAHPGPRPSFDEVTLLPPEPRGDEYAFFMAPQVEGVAALRYAIPTRRSSRDPTLRHVEVAWDNVLFNVVGRSAIANGDALRPGDYQDRRTGAQIALPPLLSIASGGIYARLHASFGDDQPTYFLDGRAVETVPPVVWPEDARKHGSAEMLHVGRAHAPIRFGATLLRATHDVTGAWAFDGMTLGLVHPDDMGVTQHVDIAYAGERAAIVVDEGTESVRGARSRLFPIRADGALADEAIPAPTQQDLAGTPRACGSAERGTTSRIVAPFHPGTRHAVVIADPIEPMRVLLTDNAVLHGSPRSACVAAYEADLVTSEAGGHQTDRALIFVEPSEHSYLFRSVDASQGESPSVSFRTMTCHADPAMDAPIEVFRERGTLVDPD
jgi:hypothetical protein